MLARTYTASLIGLEPVKIEVEVDGNRGTPAFILIGLPSLATGEARERITTALQNCGIRIRSKRTIVNLAPAEIPKTGSAFDLAIAIGLLKMYGEIQMDTDKTIFLGELALDGTVKPIHGALPLVLAAKNMGFTHVVFPQGNIPEVQVIDGITLHPIATLQEYLWAVRAGRSVPVLPPRPFSSVLLPTNWDITLDHISGQEHAKRALMITAAGGHHILLNGSPGIGKSLLAKALPSLLPPLSEREALEVTQLYSICGLTTELITQRPFRSPHHTTSQIGLIGGGARLRPGEISLAHRGVLFLDEMVEFSRLSLEALRQPLEERAISFSKAQGTITYPADFTLVGAMNPCPCGYRFSEVKACRCSAHSLDLYQKKLSGPLLDRFDLHVHVGDIEVEKLTKRPTELSGDGAPKQKQYSRERILAARQYQSQRLTSTPFLTNSEIDTKSIYELCKLEHAAENLLNQAAQRLHLSARSYFKLIKVGRTIADLEECSQIEATHIAEALQYRSES